MSSTKLVTDKDVELANNRHSEILNINEKVRAGEIRASEGVRQMDIVLDSKKTTSTERGQS